MDAMKTLIIALGVLAFAVYAMFDTTSAVEVVLLMPLLLGSAIVALIVGLSLIGQMRAR